MSSSSSHIASALLSIRALHFPSALRRRLTALALAQNAPLLAAVAAFSRTQDAADLRDSLLLLLELEPEPELELELDREPPLPPAQQAAFVWHILQ
jgi:hypothetical protein